MPETPREHHQHGINISCLQAHKLTLPLGLIPISTGPVGCFTHPVNPVPRQNKYPQSWWLREMVYWITYRSSVYCFGSGPDIPLRVRLVSQTALPISQNFSRKIIEIISNFQLTVSSCYFPRIADLPTSDHPCLSMKRRCRADMRRNCQFDIARLVAGCIRCLDYEVFLVLQDFPGVGNIGET